MALVSGSSMQANSMDESSLTDEFPVDPDELSFSHLFKISELNDILQCFGVAMNLAVLICDRAGNPLTDYVSFAPFCRLVRTTSEGTIACMETDMIAGDRACRSDGPIIQRCHAGLYHSAAAIRLPNMSLPLGYILCGNALLRKDESFPLMRKFGVEIGLCASDIEDMLEDTFMIPSNRFSRIAVFFHLFGNCLTKSAFATLSERWLINSLRLKELKLASNELLLRSIFHSIKSINLLLFDANCRVLRANQAAIEFFGLISEQDILNMSYSDLMTLCRKDDLSAVIQNPVREVLSRQCNLTLGYDCLCLCHTHQSVQRVVKVSVTFFEGTKAFCVLSLEDVSVQRQQQEAMRRASQMELIGKSVAFLTTSFSNFLTRIQEVATELLSLCTKEQRSYCETISLSAQNCLELMSQLSAFTKVSQCLNSQSHDVLHAVRHFVELYHSFNPALEICVHSTIESCSLVFDFNSFQVALLSMVLHVSGSCAQFGVPTMMDLNVTKVFVNSAPYVCVEAVHYVSSDHFVTGSSPFTHPHLDGDITLSASSFVETHDGFLELSCVEPRFASAKMCLPLIVPSDSDMDKSCLGIGAVPI